MAEATDAQEPTPSRQQPHAAAAVEDHSTSSPAPEQEDAAAAAPPATNTDDELQRLRTIELAVDEGHDADIPSNIGYVLDEKGEEKRRKSIADQRQHAHAENRSVEQPDLEKEAGLSDKPVGAADGGEDESEDEANIVWWDGPDDPENPYNWPSWRTTINCGLISALTFVTPLVSSIFAPGVPELMAEFKNSSEELAALVVSVYVLGFAFGPLLIAPLSEIYGRLVVYHVCNVGFLAFVIGCALAPTLNSLIVFRFFCGVAGSCPIVNGGGSIADMVRQEKRAGAMAIFAVGPLLGPILGPVIGGFIATAKSWRWVFWVVAIVGGFLSIVFFIFMRETYAPILLQRKTERLRKETGNPLLRSKLDVGLSPRDFFARGIIRPLKLLFLSPIVIIFALYMAVVYGYLYLMFTSMTYYFEAYYGFSTSTVGLSYLGLGIGSMIGLAYFSAVSDRYIRKQSALEGQGMKPEYRLQPLPYGALMLPVGFFIYGWTAQYHVHWIVPILGTTIIGIANLIIFMAIQMYLIDAFTIYAASSLAANTVVRSIAGACLPLGGLKMYSALGAGWGNSLLGFIALAMVPVPFLILKYGEYLRKKFELKNL